MTMLFLFLKMKFINCLQINVENVQQKYLMMRRLANEVTNSSDRCLSSRTIGRVMPQSSW